MPSVIYVAIGLPGFIRCPVDANPPVSLVKWKKDGLPLRIEKVSLQTLLIIVKFFSVSALAELFVPFRAAVSSVPWLEPNGRWEHPCGGGDGGLSGHLHLHALQHPGFYGMVPSCSPGAKGAPACHADWPTLAPEFVSLIWFDDTLNTGPSQILSGSWWGVSAGGWERAGNPL